MELVNGLAQCRDTENYNIKKLVKCIHTDDGLNRRERNQYNDGVTGICQAETAFVNCPIGPRTLSRAAAAAVLYPCTVQSDPD